MQRSPRSSSLTGLSSQGALLLALLAAGAAVFLLFVLPHMNASRAAGPIHTPRPEPAAHEGAKPVELVQLVQAPDVDLEPEQPAPMPETVPAANMTAGEEAQAVEVAKVEGPKLKYDREGGKAEKLDHKDLRAAQREQRKERRERAAAATAQGFAPEDGQPEAQKAKAAPSPERWRISNRSGTGRPGKGKGKTKGG
jgi:hypothetical protein